jgi:hypothetical protein
MVLYALCGNCLSVVPGYKSGMFVSFMDVRNAEKHAADEFLWRECLIIDNESVPV